MYIEVGIQGSHAAVRILEVVDEKHKPVFVQGYTDLFCVLCRITVCWQNSVILWPTLGVTEWLK